MAAYIEIYRDARRKLGPIESLHYVLNDAKTSHPSLKQYLNDDINLLFGQIMQTARILVSCVKDIDDFTRAGIKEATVAFARQNVIRARAHLSYYIGEDTLSLFLSEITQTPILELE
jgi:hypothetical protein